MSKFSAKLTPAGFSFNLVADNNEIIATSQVYTSKGACLKGIESVQANAPWAPVEDQTAKDFEHLENPKFEVYTDKEDKFRFRLKAENGEIIAASQGYKAKASCLNGIESVRKNAPWAEIVAEDIFADLVVFGNICTGTQSTRRPRPQPSSTAASPMSAAPRVCRTSSARTPRFCIVRASSSCPASSTAMCMSPCRSALRTRM